MFQGLEIRKENLESQIVNMTKASDGQMHLYRLSEQRYREANENTKPLCGRSRRSVCNPKQNLPTSIVLIKSRDGPLDRLINS